MNVLLKLSISIVLSLTQLLASLAIAEAVVKGSMSGPLCHEIVVDSQLVVPSLNNSAPVLIKSSKVYEKSLALIIDQEDGKDSKLQVYYGSSKEPIVYNFQTFVSLDPVIHGEYIVVQTENGQTFWFDPKGKKITSYTIDGSYNSRREPLVVSKNYIVQTLSKVQNNSDQLRIAHLTGQMATGKAYDLPGNTVNSILSKSPIGTTARPEGSQAGFLTLSLALHPTKGYSSYLNFFRFDLEKSSWLQLPRVVVDGTALWPVLLDHRNRPVVVSSEGIFTYDQRGTGETKMALPKGVNSMITGFVPTLQNLFLFTSDPSSKGNTLVYTKKVQGTREQRWKKAKMGSTIITPPIEVGDSIFAATAKGQIYVFSLKTGRQTQKIEFSQSKIIRMKYIATGPFKGNVVVGTLAGTVYFLNKDGRVLASKELGPVSMIYEDGRVATESHEKTKDKVNIVGATLSMVHLVSASCNEPVSVQPKKIDSIEKP